MTVNRKANPIMSLGGSRQAQVSASMAGWDEADFGTDVNHFLMGAPTASNASMTAKSSAPRVSMRTQANLGFAGGLTAAMAPRRATVTMAASKTDETTVSGDTEIEATQDYQDMLFYSRKYDRLSELPHYVGN